MRQSRIVSAALGLACLLVPALVLGQDQTGTTSTYSLGETVVVGEKAPGPLQEEKSQPATETSLDQDAIRTFGGPGQTNPYKALNLLPSVNAEGTDPYGLTQDQNNLRIRGQAGLTYNRLSRTINGLPLGVNVGNGSMPCVWWPPPRNCSPSPWSTAKGTSYSTPCALTARHCPKPTTRKRPDASSRPANPKYRPPLTEPSPTRR